VQSMLAAAVHTVPAGLDVVSGSTARHWGVGTKPSKSQQQRFKAACQQLIRALQESHGPYLVGEQPSLVRPVLAGLETCTVGAIRWCSLRMFTVCRQLPLPEGLAAGVHTATPNPFC
jgi:hypothetical protein